LYFIVEYLFSEGVYMIVSINDDEGIEELIIKNE